MIPGIRKRNGGVAFMPFIAFISFIGFGAAFIAFICAFIAFIVFIGTSARQLAYTTQMLGPTSA